MSRCSSLQGRWRICRAAAESRPWNAGLIFSSHSGSPVFTLRPLPVLSGAGVLQPWGSVSYKDTVPGFRGLRAACSRPRAF